MREQGGSYSLAMVLLGGRKLGPATALVDEDVLRVLLLDAGPAKPALRLGLEPDSRTSAKYAATPNTHAKLGCKYLGDIGIG